MKFAVIQTGGKQYVVSENSELTVDHINQEAGSTVEFVKLAEGDDEKNTIELGTPELSTKVKGTVMDTLKGDKIRVARYKSKTRFSKVTGFRPMLSKIKITAL